MRNFILGVLAAIGIGTAAIAQTNPTVEEQRLESQKQVMKDAVDHADMQTKLMKDKFNAFGFMQFRWSYNGEGIAGFEVRKGVIGVEGELNDNWSMVLSGEWTPDASFDLRDAYADAKYDSFGFRGGRFRAPFMIEWQTNEPELLANDYSVIAYTFGQGRSEGIQFSYDVNEKLSLLFSYNNGFQQPNVTLFNNETWGVSARANYAHSATTNIGAAIAYNDTPLTNNFNWTVDGKAYLIDHLYTFASYTGRSDDISGDGWGVLFQSGYDLFENTTLYGEYEVGDIQGTQNLLSILSAGVTHKFASNVRWTNELGYSFEAIDAAWNLDQTGWRNSTGNEVLFTSQLTISF